MHQVSAFIGKMVALVVILFTGNNTIMIAESPNIHTESSVVIVSTSTNQTVKKPPVHNVMQQTSTKASSQVPVAPTTTPVNPNASFMEVHAPAGIVDPLRVPTSTAKTVCETKVAKMDDQIKNLTADMNSLTDGGFSIASPFANTKNKYVEYHGTQITYIQAYAQYTDIKNQIAQLTQDAHYISLTCDL